MWTGWPKSIIRGAHNRIELNMIRKKKLAVARMWWDFLRSRLNRRNMIKWMIKIRNMANSSDLGIIHHF
jgi:hypothetical protein